MPKVTVTITPNSACDLEPKGFNYPQGKVRTAWDPRLVWLHFVVLCPNH